MKRGLAIVAVVAVATTAAAQEKPEYVVVAGDTCELVAKKVYGDPKRYDLLHEANPQLGPMPHKLKPGTVLRTPKPGAAAKVTFIRKDVEASTPGAHTAKLNEDLDRGHKVSTLADSSAELTFKDTSRLQLSEHTLVVILGASSLLSSQKQASASDTTLMKGELYAHLGALAGKPKPIATPSGTVEIGGESKVSVDPKSTTRLAVYKGKSSLAAAGKKVEVDQGFGSKADLGKPPTKPVPLPRAPAWTVAIPTTLLTFGSADVSGTFGTTEAGIQKFHVQLARDSAFNDLIVDARLPASVTKLEARNVASGTYHARVSAIDADLFEGPFGEVATLRVVAVAARTATATVDGTIEVPGMFCGLDGGPLAQAAITLPRGKAHVLRCALTATGEGAAELPIDASYAGAVAANDAPAPTPTPTPTPAPPPAVEPTRFYPWELGLWTGGYDARRRLGLGSVLALELSGNLRTTHVVLSLGLRPSWERYGVGGTHDGHTADVLCVGLPVRVRPAEEWAPYLAITPQFLYDRVRTNVNVEVKQIIANRIASRASFGVAVGAGVRLAGSGPFSLHFEAGYRFAPRHAIANGNVDVSGVYAALTGRFGL